MLAVIHSAHKKHMFSDLLQFSYVRYRTSVEYVVAIEVMTPVTFPRTGGQTILVVNAEQTQIAAQKNGVAGQGFDRRSHSLGAYD